MCNQIKWFKRLRKTSNPDYTNSLSEKQKRQELKELFENFDKDKSDSLELHELHVMFCSVGMNIDFHDLCSLFSENMFPHNKITQKEQNIRFNLQQFSDFMLSQESNRRFKIISKELRRQLIEEDVHRVRIEIMYMPCDLNMMLSFLYKKYVHKKNHDQICRNMNNIKKQSINQEGVKQDFNKFELLFDQEKLKPETIKVKDAFFIPREEIQKRIERKNYAKNKLLLNLINNLKSKQTSSKQNKISFITQNPNNQQSNLNTAAATSQNLYNSDISTRKSFNNSLIDEALKKYNNQRKLTQDFISTDQQINDNDENAEAYSDNVQKRNKIIFKSSKDKMISHQQQSHSIITTGGEKIFEEDDLPSFRNKSSLNKGGQKRRPQNPYESSKRNQTRNDINNIQKQNSAYGFTIDQVNEKINIQDKPMMRRISLRYAGQSQTDDQVKKIINQQIEEKGLQPLFLNKTINKSIKQYMVKVDKDGLSQSTLNTNKYKSDFSDHSISKDYSFSNQRDNKSLQEYLKTRNKSEYFERRKQSSQKHKSISSIFDQVTVQLKDTLNENSLDRSDNIKLKDQIMTQQQFFKYKQQLLNRDQVFSSYMDHLVKQ